MSTLEATQVRGLLSAGARDGVDAIECFDSIASTNTYLLGQPPPPAGRCRVVIADHQSAGRGRHFRRWVSPPGSGLCLSFAYTFDETPKLLSSLTLAIGVSIAAALKHLGAIGVRLKWPNDIVALDGKLGGILTEVQPRNDRETTVVTGIGLNLHFPAGAETTIESDWARRPVDVKSIIDSLPDTGAIAAAVIDNLYGAMQKFAALGFPGFADDWKAHDWLREREITVDLPDRQVTGIAVGVDVDGALLIDTGKEKTRIVSGSIVMAGPRQPT